MNYKNLSCNYKLQDLIEGINTVIMKLQCLRDKIHVTNHDGRQVGLYGMQEILIGFGLTVHSISGAGLRPRQRTVTEVEESFENYATIGNKNIKDLLTLTESTWRHSIIALFHFKLDALFQNLLRTLGVTPGKTGFTTNAKNLLQQINLPNSSRLLEILTILTFIRNSLHNNGIHRGNDFGPFFIHSMEYKFQKDYDVNCASFGHVLAILEETVDALRDILLTPKISSLKYVEDRYVFLNP